MIDDLIAIGLRPLIAGCAVILIALIAGWGIAADNRLPPVRLIAWWVEGVLVRLIQASDWSVRAAAIFANNASVCALLVLVGRVPGGGWIGVTMVGMSMGIALRVLARHGATVEKPVAAGRSEPHPIDTIAKLGVAANLVEVPAIGLVLGLSMGQQAAPNGMTTGQIWGVFLRWVIPALIIAACGESTWIGRLRPFGSRT